MERNNIKAAVRVHDFWGNKEVWEKSDFNNGSVDFYTFMTTPTPQREAFILSRGTAPVFAGAVVIPTV